MKTGERQVWPPRLVEYRHATAGWITVELIGWRMDDSVHEHRIRTVKHHELGLPEAFWVPSSRIRPRRAERARAS